MYLTSLVHAQDGWTLLLVAAKNGHVEITQVLLEKGGNIEATDKVQSVANIYWLTMHGLLQCEVVNIY